MYCDQCGSSLSHNAQFCTVCGKAVIAGGIPQTLSSPPPPLTEDRVQKHLPVLAALWLASGILRLLATFWFFLVGRFLLSGLWGSFPFAHHFSTWQPFGTFGILSAGALLGSFGLLHLFLAWSLYERKPWARTLALVVGFLALLRVPLGTALGIYTLWVFSPESSQREYQRLAHAS